MLIVIFFFWLSSFIECIYLFQLWKWVNRNNFTSPFIFCVKRLILSQLGFFFFYSIFHLTPSVFPCFSESYLVLLRCSWVGQSENNIPSEGLILICAVATEYFIICSIPYAHFCLFIGSACAIICRSTVRLSEWLDNYPKPTAVYFGSFHVSSQDITLPVLSSTEGRRTPATPSKSYSDSSTQ